MKLAHAKAIVARLQSEIAAAEAAGRDEIPDLAAAQALDDQARDELARAIATASARES